MFWDGVHADDLIVPIQFLQEGKNWTHEKFTRCGESIKSSNPQPVKQAPQNPQAVKKQVPPAVRKQIMSGRENKRLSRY